MFDMAESYNHQNTVALKDFMKKNEKIKLVNNWHERFNQQLMGFIGKSIKQKDDLYDISQEVYLRMLRVKNPEMIKYPKAYLFKVAIHVLDEWRNHNLNQFAHVETNDFNKINEANKYKIELKEISSSSIDLNNALSSIPSIYSTTIIMKWHYGKSYIEISRDLEISQRQVKRYIVKGYAALRIKLDKLK